MKNGKYREKIISLFKKKHLLNAEDVAKKIPEANFSTIYRNIISMEKEGILKKVVIDRQNIKYELIEADDHDHIICENCGIIESIDVKRKEISKNLKGFSVNDITVRGRCGECKVKKRLS